MATPPLLIGIGNLHRGDDAVGRIVLRRLQERGAEGATFLEHDGEGTTLIASWSGADSVFLIDAIRRGGKPGSIHRLDLRDRPIPDGSFPLSTHAFGVGEGIEMARALNRLPRRIVLYGIEGGEFEIGSGLTPAVARAAEEVAARLVKEIEADMRMEK